MTICVLNKMENKLRKEESCTVRVEHFCQKADSWGRVIITENDFKIIEAAFDNLVINHLCA